MNIQILDDSLAKIENINTQEMEQFQKIRETFSYTKPVFFHGKPYPKKTYMIHGHSKVFSVGLLPLIQKKFGPLSITDARKHDLNLNISYDGLHSYQKDVLQQAITSRRCIISMPTGAGKSFIISHLANEIASKHSNTQTVIVVPSEEILKQIAERIKPEYLGFVKGNKEEFDKPVILTTGQTLNARFDLYRDEKKFFNTKILIADEVHYFGANSFFKISYLFPNTEYRIGFSSTPKGRSDNADLRITGVFSDKIIGTDETKIPRIVPLKILMLKYKLRTNLNFDNLDALEQYNDLLLVDERKEAIYTIVKKLNEQKLTWLLFTDRLAYGEDLANRLEVPFVNANSDRQTIFKQLHDKEIPGVVTTIGKEGLDIPNLGCIINSSIIATPISIIQKSGRVKRKAETKNAGLVIDFWDGLNSKTERWSKKRLKIYEKIGSVSFLEI